MERWFQGLMLNFNWWVNRKDPEGRSVFAGVSWGWTTSECSIAARRCLPGTPRSGRWNGMDGAPDSGVRAGLCRFLGIERLDDDMRSMTTTYRY
jgi:hypothetical protein